MSIVILVLFVHFLSDWILQPRSVAKRKSSSWLWMMKHLLVIHLGFGALALCTGASLWLVCLNTLVHGIQDKVVWSGFAKFRGPYTPDYMQHNRYAEDYWWYFTIAVDQFLHLTLLALIFVR